MAARRSSVIKVLISGDSTGLTSALDDSQGKLQRFGAMALKATAAVGAAVGALGVAAIREFAKFDAALQKSVAIMGDVSDSLRNDMADAAREVARVTTFSAEQAAESYFFLASAGLDAESSIAAMPKVAAFAQAGMFDMALATDLLTDAQSALGMTIRDDSLANMEQMVRLSDVLVKANTLANASVSQFSEALTNKAGAALRAINKDVEEGVAVLAAFADQGIKGSEAGTQLAIVLRDLSTRALKNKDDFAAVGFSVFDSAGKMRNLGDIVANLEDVLRGMSDETQKATLLQMGFSDKSLASLTALLGTSEAIKKYEDQLRSANGVTAEIADKQLQTFTAQLGLLRSNLMDVGIEIGGALVPSLMGIVTWIQTNGPALRVWAEETGQRIGTFVTDVREGFAKVKTFFDDNVAGPADAAREAIVTFADKATVRLSVLKETFEPFLMAFVRFFQDIRFLIKRPEQMGEEFGAALGNIITMGIFQLRLFKGEITKGISDLIGDIDFFALGRSFLTGLIQFGLGFVVAFLSFDWFIPVAKTIKDNFGAIFMAAIGFALAPAAVAGKITNILAKIPFVGRFLAFLGTKLNAAGGPMRERFKLFFEGAVEGFTNAMRALGPGLISRFVTFLRQIPASVTTFLDDIAIKGALFASRLGGGLATGIRGLLSRLHNILVRPLLNWARTGFDDFIINLRIIGENLMLSLRSGILSKVGAIIRSVRDAVTGAINSAKALLGIKSPSRVFLEIGSDLAEGFALGVARGAAEMRSAVGMLSGASVSELTTSINSRSAPSHGGGVVNVTVTSADPEAVVEALRRYTRGNGPLGQVVNV